MAELGIWLSTNTPFTKKLQLPRSRAIRRRISKLTASVNRVWINGGQPISGLFTLVGKAERLDRGHPFRNTVAKILRNHRKRVKAKA